MKTRIRVVLTTFALLSVGVSLSTAQVLSNGTGGGDWDLTTTWQGGAVPTPTDDAVIVGTDSVNIPSTIVTAMTVNSLTIQSGAKLAASFGSGGSLSVTGALTIASNGWYYSNYSSGTSWPTAGSYSIDNASNYVQTAAGSSTVGQAGRATFGNLINAKTGSGSVCGADLTINGDLIVRTGGTGTTFRGTNSTIGVNQTHHVYGNVYVISGQWVAVDAPGSISGLTCIWDIDGNITVGDASAVGQARFGSFASSDGGVHRVGIFNVGGNLSITNGARLQVGSSSSSSTTTETGIINIGGNFTTDATAIYATNSKGWFAINFVGSGTQTITLGNQLKFSSTSNPATINDTVATGSNVVFNSGQTWTCGSSLVGANGYGAWVVDGSLTFGTESDAIIGYQDFNLNSGATLATTHTNGVAANIQCSGTQTYSKAANYTYNGSAAQITGSQLPDTVNNLNISNSAGVTLTNGVTVTGSCSIASGASVVESAGKYILGTMTTTQAVGTGSLTLGGIGVSIDSGPDDLGNVSVSRVAGLAGAITIGPNSGINRSWTITSDNPPSAGRNLTLIWDSGDDGSIASDLTTAKLWKSTDGGSNWFEVGSEHDVTSARSITENVTSFSKWTVSNAANALPVEMSSFVAAGIKSGAILRWITKTEVSCNGFNIERRETGASTWTKVAFVQGAGTSNREITYEYCDNVTPGNYVYRLEQVDNDGLSRYVGSVEVVAGIAPKVFELCNNFPNPFNPTTEIRFSVPVDGYATLKVYNVLGQEVATLYNGFAKAGQYIPATFNAANLASGIYFSRLDYNGKSLVHRMILTK